MVSVIDEGFTCSLCGARFSVEHYENYETVYCPVCKTEVWTQRKMIVYTCDECGNEFTSERQPHFCPYCGGEDLSVR